MFDAVLVRRNTENYMIVVQSLFFRKYFFRLRSGNTDALSKSSVKFAF